MNPNIIILRWKHTHTSFLRVFLLCVSYQQNQQKIPIGDDDDNDIYIKDKEDRKKEDQNKEDHKKEDHKKDNYNNSFWGLGIFWFCCCIVVSIDTPAFSHLLEIFLLFHFLWSIYSHGITSELLLLQSMNTDKFYYYLIFSFLDLEKFVKEI